MASSMVLIHYLIPNEQDALDDVEVYQELVSKLTNWHNLFIPWEWMADSCLLFSLF